MNVENRDSIMVRAGQLLQTNKLAKVIEIISLFIIAIIFIKIFEKNAGDNLIYRQAVIWSANILMLLYVWAGIKIRGQNWQDFGLSFKKPGWKDSLNVFTRSLLVFFLAMLGFAIGSIIMANITGIPESSDMSGYTYLQDNIWMLVITLVGVYIVSSFGEEVVYRAFLINRMMELGLSSKLGRSIAVLISAVIFGFAHYGWGPMGIVQTTFMGLALGFCYIYFKRRLWILILAHAYMDTILMMQMYLASN